MKKVTTLVLMLCLVLSGALCYASGVARTENGKGVGSILTKKKAARLQINGKSSHNDYSVWIWDSSKKNGGYKLLNTKDVFYRFIIAK